MNRRLALTILAVLTFGAVDHSHGGRRMDRGPETAVPTLSIDRWPSGVYGVRSDTAIEKRIAALLAKMDLDRKIGQMLQVSIDQCTYDDVRNYHIGSVLNGGGSYPRGNKNASAAEWASMADSFWLASMADTMVQVPIMWGTDAVHGHNNVRGATIFPHNIGLGAANDPSLMLRIGEATAREVAATGLDWTFAPVVAVARDDRWGRTYESFSENPDRVRVLAAAYIKGVQGTFEHGRVIATAKHYIGDGGTFMGIDRGDTRTSEQELIALHAPGYIAALDAGVQTIMVSFSSWNREAMHGHRYLITEVLKKRLRFDGIVISDWNGIGEVAGCTNADCPKAVNAGIDMFMVPFAADWKAFITTVKQQVAQGEIPMARIDDAVTRILRVKFRAGLFSKPRPSQRAFPAKDSALGAAAHRMIAREAVRKSLVLLKNNNALLPLDRSARILVAGKSADCIQNQCGGWSRTWQGTGNTNADFPNATSVLGAIRKTAKNVTFDETAAQAKKGMYDLAIVVIGETPYAEFSGDIKGGLTLEHAASCPGDLALLERIKKIGLPIVTLFFSGRPLCVNKELNRSDAFVAAWLPGSEAEGITDVLFKNEKGGIHHDFSGTLSFSWPKSPCQTPLNHGDSVYMPLFSYGFGLTYASKSTLPDTLPEVAHKGYGCTGLTISPPGDNKPLLLFPAGDSSMLPRIGDPGNWAGVSGGAGARLTNVSVSADTGKRQKNAVRLTFRDMAYWGIMCAKKDLSSLFCGRYVVAFDVKVHRKPDKQVLVSIVCGYPCKASYDVTATVRSCAPDTWNTIRIPLAAFARADFFSIDCPFMVETDGAMEISLADIRWEAEAAR